MTSDLNDYSYYSDLLSKLLTDRLTPDEKECLEIWKNENEKNLRLYNKIVSISYTREMKERHSEYDAKSAYKIVRMRFRRKQMVMNLRRMAVAVVLLFACVMCVRYWFREEAKDITVAKTEIKCGGSRAELILFDGQRIGLDEATKDTISTRGGQIIAVGKGIRYQEMEEVEAIEYNTLRVPSGGEFELILADGTVVILNSDSEVRYPVKFVGNERRIYLSGEAFLEVTEDKRRPFIVTVENSEIRVLGTSFNVHAYPDEKEVFTTLVTGAVEIVSGGKNIRLSPGEQGVIDSIGGLSKHDVDTELYTGWKEGKLIFCEETLESVMKIISRWYNVEVFFENPESKKILFTGNVMRYDNFEKILEMLEITGDTRFRIEGNSVFVTK